MSGRVTDSCPAHRPVHFIGNQAHPPRSVQHCAVTLWSRTPEFAIANDYRDLRQAYREMRQESTGKRNSFYREMRQAVPDFEAGFTGKRDRKIGSTL